MWEEAIGPGAGSSVMAKEREDDEVKAKGVKAANPIPNNGNDLYNCAFSVTLTSAFHRLKVVLGDLLHAVFISVLPKLPCARRCLLALVPLKAYNYLSFNCLAPQPESGFWHLTCMEDGRQT